MSTIIEPCCNDCFWDTKINYTDYSQGFMAGVKYAQEKVAHKIWEFGVEDPETEMLFAALLVEVKQVLRSEPN